jgi:hypothetical protein
MRHAWWSLIGMFFLVGPLSAAPPSEWVAKQVSYATCTGVSGDTNLATSNPGVDYAHTLTCTVDANRIKAGTMVRACAMLTVTTAASVPTLQFKLKAGATTLYAPLFAFPPEVSLTRTTAFCFDTMGITPPGPTGNTQTSVRGFPTEVAYTEQSNSIAQPVSLATNGPLVWTFVSRWSSSIAGNSVTLNHFQVEVGN